MIVKGLEIIVGYKKIIIISQFKDYFINFKKRGISIFVVEKDKGFNYIYFIKKFVLIKIYLKFLIFVIKNI